MDREAPDPSIARAGATLWVAYFTDRHDHCAVLRFTDVTDFWFGDPNDKQLWGGPVAATGLQLASFHQVDDDLLSAAGRRRWIVTFHDDTLDVTARQVEIVARAVEVRRPDDAIAMVRTGRNGPRD